MCCPRSSLGRAPAQLSRGSCVRFQPGALFMKTHTFRDWYKDHNPWDWHWFRLRKTYGELGWKYFGLRQWRMFKASGFIPELWYYLKCRFWKRYNVVKARSLPPTWVDRDRLLLHAAFEILRDVVENEDWFNDRVYWQPDYDGRETWQAAAMLYDWWVNRRPARLEAEEKALKSWQKNWHQLELAGEREDDVMLIRLCMIRGNLWT
jgi:hypothetical protein